MVLIFGIDRYYHLPDALLSIWNRRFGNTVNNPQLAIVAWRHATVARIRGGKAGAIPAREVGRAIFNVLKHYRCQEESKAYQLLEQIVCQLLLERPSFGTHYELLPQGMTYSDWVTWRAQLFQRLLALDLSLSVNEFVHQVRDIFQESLAVLQPGNQSKLSSKIAVTSRDKGKEPLSNFFDSFDENRIAIETVHQMKGSTLDGIMLVGGYDEEAKTSDVAEWFRPSNPVTGFCEEPRRIAYVAMTRPRKLLVVAMPRECGDALVYHDDWKKGNFEYKRIEDVLPLGN